ncbi:MAG: VOC family protein [Anaerolineaceae bacterium]|nr:VOC family protein [Anaerolineaceae bacterium]
MHLNRLYQIAVHVDDLDASLAFYQDTLGAKQIAKFDSPGLAFLDFSGTRLLLEKGGGASTLYFWVDDIDAAYEELKEKGVEFIDQPHLIFPDASGMFGPPNEEEWTVFFKDPAGNLLALATRKVTGT